jgi:PKD repeat protein
MRSIAVLALATGTLLLALACSDGGGTPPPDNTAPEAKFDLPPCVIDVVCNFASTSTDDEQVTGWSWDFDGDAKPDANTAAASFKYTTARDFDVSLRVLDAQGLSDTKTSTITIAPPTNAAPVANFEVPPCVLNVPCDFASSSTDDVQVITWSWDFNGDGTPDANTETASYRYTSGGDYSISLTVHDAQGLSDTKTSTITINTPPTAGFTYACDATNCRFTSTSTDVAPGTIAAFAWSFGDGATSSANNPAHSYAITAPRNFTVTLTVTDNEGVTDVETQTITVSPPPPGAEGCITSGRNVDCALNITARSTIKLKLLGLNCDLREQRVTIPQPIGDQVFLRVCLDYTVGDSTRIFGGPLDEAIVFEAGSQARIRFTQGIPNPGDPPLGPPAARLEGTFPSWTISFEDADDPTAAGEPDFADVVLGVGAVPAP